MSENEMDTRFPNGAVPLGATITDGVPEVLIENPRDFPWGTGPDGPDGYRNATEDEYVAWKAYWDAEED